MLVKLKNLFARGLGKRPQVSLAEKWTDTWSQPDLDAMWLTDEIPESVISAIDDGFFKPGQTLIEMGCGRGDIAAFLARKDLKVTAGDFAPSAIALANDLFGDHESPADFQVLDACHDIPSAAPFDVAFDRGCFHNLKADEQRQGYARTLATNLKPGGSFLMLHRTAQTAAEEADIREVIVSSVDQFFGQSFERVACQAIQMAGSGDTGMKGLAFWMRRK